MNTKNTKAKGGRFEKYLSNVFKENLDKNTRLVVGSGSGENKNDLLIPRYEIEVEAKNQNTIHLIKDWEQLQRQLFTGGNKGILAIRNPKKPEFQETLIVLSLEDWIDLAKSSGKETEVITTLDRDTKWALENLKSSINKVLKKIIKDNG